MSRLLALSAATLAAFVLAVAATAGPARTQHSRLVISRIGAGTVTSNPEAIVCGSTCGSTFIQNSTVTLTATPEEAFIGWGGGCSGTDHICRITMPSTDTSIGVTATFSGANGGPGSSGGAISTLAVTKAGTGSGTVFSDPPGIACGSTCSARFDAGAAVKLSVTPSSGSVFNSFSGPCTGTTCTVILNTDVLVGATFDATTFPVTVTLSGEGTGSVASSPTGIACGTTCTSVFSSGAQVTLTPTAEDGSVFRAWSGACASAGTGACTVTLTQATTVDAAFDVAPDTTPPKATALPGTARAGTIAKLRYTASDDRGITRERILLFNKTSLVKRFAVGLHPATDAVRFVPWRVPAKALAGVRRFCVVSFDDAGNASSQSCAQVRITAPPAPRKKA
jgi:hypothetical protein